MYRCIAVVAGISVGVCSLAWAAEPVETGGAPDPSSWTTPRVAPSVKPTPQSIAKENLQVVDFGGVLGDVFSPFKPHKSGDVFEYSEDVVVRYNRPMDLDSLQGHLAIEPKTSFSIYAGYDYGKSPKISVRKLPGVSYTLTIRAGVKGQNNTVDSSEHVFVFTTDRNVPQVTPLRATPNEPYRYGTLGHPFPYSLGGEHADQEINMLAEAGVGYVRIDYVGAQSNPKKGEYDFSIQDKILDKLIARGITELPIIDQYTAPSWANRGQKYPAIWENPDDFADFAGAVARHMGEKYPQVTRIEIFNEPNLHGWWTHPDPNSPYADRSGKAAATYMIAAYKAIKAANPKITVVGPALATGGRHTSSKSYFKTMYDNGCRRGNGWDVLSIHNYSWFNPTATISGSNEARFDVYKDMQSIATAHGDEDVHVMLTEWGYSSFDSPLGFAPEVQAYYLGLGFNRMLADPTVDGVTYVNIYNPGKDFWGMTAVLDKDYKPLPAFYVFQKFAKAQPAVKGK